MTVHTKAGDTGSGVRLVDGRGLTKAYGELTALAPTDLAIGPGERVAVAGPSGSGKTTLLNFLAGLAQPDGGRLFLDGQDTRDLRPGKELSELVGIIDQQLNLVPQLPVVQNVLAGRLGQWGFLRSVFSLVSPRERPAAFGALERLGIADKANERTSHLSGGEQQRVAIARMMVQRPKLVVADEPVSALDPARADEILGLLTDMVAGMANGVPSALVASLHDPGLIRKHFSRVIGLREGRLQFDIPAAELSAPVLEALYDLDRNGGGQANIPVF